MAQRKGIGAVGWVLAGLALAACLVMIAVGLAGILRGERATPLRAEARSSVPTPAPSRAAPTPAPDLGSELVVVDPRTDVERPVAPLRGNQWNGERSPNGQRIVFVEHPRSGIRSQIMVLEPDGTVRQLTRLPRGAFSPAWSPDGRWIAFVAAGDIFVMRADGSDIRRLGGTPGDDDSPDWSPDGAHIAFRSGPLAKPQTPPNIWMLSFQDGRLTRLTSGGDGDSYPTWSPRGDRILFLRYERSPDGNLERADSDFFLVRSNGTELERLLIDEGPLGGPTDWGMASPDSHFQDAPTWSPDGRRVAYSGGHCDCITIVDVARGEIVRSIIGQFTDVSWDSAGILASLGE